MAAWKNLDTLASYGELSKLKNHVDIAKAMSGENGAERVKTYSTPMAEGLAYNYAAKAGRMTKCWKICRNWAKFFVSDRLKAIRVIPSPKVSVGVSLAENVLELHLNPGNFGMEELAEILSKYDRKKKFYRLRTGEFMDMDEDGIRVLSELRENLQISEAKLKSGEITIPKYRALYLDTRLKRAG